MWLYNVRHFLLIMISCFCLFGSVSGCGYRLEPYGPLSRNVSQVFVPVFENTTTYPYAGVSFSNAMIQEIMEQTTTRISKGKDSSCQLRGHVKKIVFSPVVRDVEETVYQEKITIWTDMELTDETGKILWNERDMKISKDYAASRPDTATIQSKEAGIQNAIQAIAKRTAQKAVSAMKNDF